MKVSAEAEAVALNKLLGLPRDSGSDERLREVQHLVDFHAARRKQAKLSDEQAEQVRARYLRGGAQGKVTKLCLDFGVTKSTIYDILRRRSYRGKP